MVASRSLGTGAHELPAVFICDTLTRYCRSEGCKKSLNSYQIVPERCVYVDHQRLKLQELPESVPPSEMPRHVLMTVDRALANTVAPGVRVRIVGIVRPHKKTFFCEGVGVEALPSLASGRSSSAEFTPEEEAQVSPQ